MKLRQLESLLEDVDDFGEPKIELEQYTTPPHLAACVVHTAHGRGDIEDKVVLDLGCGPAVLGIAATLMGAASVTGFDVDENALEVAAENVEGFEDMHEEFIRGSVANLPLRQVFDTVIMNPPFGTRRKGADMEFLVAGVNALCPGGAVYSLHKARPLRAARGGASSSTRDHIAKFATTTLRCTSEVVATLRYNLPATYKFHKSKSQDIEVDLWHFRKPARGKGAGDDAAASSS